MCRSLRGCALVSAHWSAADLPFVPTILVIPERPTYDGTSYRPSWPPFPRADRFERAGRVHAQRRVVTSAAAACAESRRGPRSHPRGRPRRPGRSGRPPPLPDPDDPIFGSRDSAISVCREVLTWHAGEPGDQHAAEAIRATIQRALDSVLGVASDAPALPRHLSQALVINKSGLICRPCNSGRRSQPPRRAHSIRQLPARRGGLCNNFAGARAKLSGFWGHTR
jgi:hypothetical protein